MPALILSCNTGEGHNACARAIKEVYDVEGEACQIEDGLRFISDGASKVISSGHVFLYRRLPRLFGWGYAMSEKHPAVFEPDSPLYGLFSRGADDLYRFIADGGYDSVICTHPFTALMLTEVQRRYRLPVKTAFVATDYTCSPGVKDSELNLYFIPDETLIPDFACANIPPERIVVSGIPIRQMFYVHTEKGDAKQRQRIPADHKHMVMMCGSMGCGHMDRLARFLSRNLREDCELTVICGTNKRLRRRLERRHGDRENIHIRGYVQDMSAMLDSADIYLTKPGGISVTEAAAKGLPMVFAKAVEGCETYNRQWFVRMEAATAAEGKPSALGRSCTSILTDENKRRAMAEGLGRMNSGNAAMEIYRRMRAG